MGAFIVTSPDRAAPRQAHRHSARRAEQRDKQIAEHTPERSADAN
jgi:hypothetical protein